MPWLTAKTIDGKWGVGCSACWAAGSCSAWGTFQIRSAQALRLHKLRAHANTAAHVLAEGGSVEKTSAPTENDFRSVLQSRRQGDSHNKLDKAVSLSRDRNKQLAWCLAEATRYFWRKCLSHAKCIALHSDGANRLHCVSFNCLHEKTLEMSWGTLGIVRDCGTGSAAIEGAVLACIDKFCTEKTGAPRGLNTSARLLPELKSRILERTHLFNADGASDEQRAGRWLMQSLPGLKWRTRDKTHASRRIITKPWAADRYLAGTFDLFIAAKDSPTRLIENSDDIKRIFAKHCRSTKDKLVDSTSIRNLGYAKQRMDSSSTPCGRCVVWLDALLMTCVEVSVSRTGTPKQRADKFLHEVSEERILQLAMLADAADDGLSLTRFTDENQYDVARLPHELNTFVQNMKMLFVESQCVNMGFTKAAIVLLARSRIFPKDGEQHILGGDGAVTTEMVQRCCQRMKSFVRLAQESIDAEYPEWELCQAFQLFDLAIMRQPKCDQNPTRQRSFSRLAQSLNLSETKLIVQFQDHLVQAWTNFHSGSGLSSFECWRQAALQSQSRQSMREKHSVSDLRPALEAYGLFCGNSTSNTERTFEVTRRVISDYRRRLDAITEDDDITLAQSSRVHGTQNCYCMTPGGSC